MSRLLALIRKVFLALLKDPKSRFVIIGPPIIQLVVFGYAATFDVTDVPLAVYNESPDEASRDLVARFEGSPNFRRVATITSDNQTAPLIDSRKALVVLHLGSTFGRDLRRDGRASVQVILDGRDSNTALITLGYARTIVNDFNGQWARERGAGEAPARLEVRSWFNPNQRSRWFIVPGIVGLLTLVVTMLVTALSVVREREQGTFDQLLVTPYRPWEILVGKATPGFILGVAEATLIIIVAADVTDQANDARQVEPLVEQTIENLDEVGVEENIGAFTADAGYFSEVNVTALDANERIDEACMATGRLKHHEQVPPQFPDRLLARCVERAVDAVIGADLRSQ